LLGPEVLKNVADRKQRHEEKECERVQKKTREFRTLHDKVIAIKTLGKTNEQLNVSQLRTMVLWYKHATDLPTPTNRQFLLNRLNEICRRDEPNEPILFFARQANNLMMPVEPEIQEELIVIRRWKQLYAPYGCTQNDCHRQAQ
jgi:hypothetical protein